MLVRSLCHLPRITRVLNSVAAGRRLAQRTAATQALVTLATALVCLLSGREAALGALVGGGAMTLGGLVAAWSAFGGGVQGAGMALGRLLLGHGGEVDGRDRRVFLAIAVWHLPAMAVLGRRGAGRGRHVGGNEILGVRLLN